MLSTVNTEFQVINWATVRELDSNGFENGAHSMSHPHMNKIPMSYCQRGLEGSRRILEEIIDHEVRNMAYPFGHYDERVIELAHEAGANSKDHMLTLSRLNIGMEDTIIDFVIRVFTAKNPIRELDMKLIILGSKLPKPIKQFIKRYLINRKSI